jgi:type VI secretion system secreted protein Hcp
MFMKIDDVSGEAQDTQHKEHIELHGWSWGVAQSGSSHSGSGSGTGKVSVRDLTYRAHVDKSVPPLLKMAATGKTFKKAKLTICKATGGDALEYFIVTMKNGIISDVTFPDMEGDERQVVRVSLNFSSVEVDYTPQDTQGSGQGAVTMQYSISENSGGSS